MPVARGRHLRLTPTAPAPAGPREAQAGSLAAPSGARIVSLDAVRGLMLVVSVVADSLLAPPGWFDHAPWAGVHPLDVVFPVFVTLTGCGLAFAYRRRIAVRPMLRRALVLTTAGLVFTLAGVLVTTGWAGWPVFRLTGVLQLYAAVVLLIALGHLLTRTARGWVVITAVLAAAHTGLLALWAGACPGGELTPGCNPSQAIDTAVFGAGHLYAAGARGHDPEGLVALLGACISASAGAAAGHALLSTRQRRDGAGPTRSPRGAVLPLLGLAAALALAAVAVTLLAPGVPAMKRLWTAPFALPVAAAVVLVLLAGHLLLDQTTRPKTRSRRADAAAWPLLALGRNSLLVYFGSHLLVLVLINTPAPDGQPSLAHATAEALAVTGQVQLTWSLVLLTAWVTLAGLLHARRWYLRP